MLRRLPIWVLVAALFVGLVLFFLMRDSKSPKEESSAASDRQHVAEAVRPQSNNPTGSVYRPNVDSILLMSGTGRTPSTNAQPRSTQNRGLADYVARPDIGQTISQLNTSADPANWFLSMSINKWCASVGSIDAKLAGELRDMIGSDADPAIGMIEYFKASCGYAAERALSAPNLRGGDLAKHDYDWKLARGVQVLASAEPEAAKAALVALGMNRDLMASWLDSVRFTLNDAPLLAEIPPNYRQQVVLLAACEANPELCHPTSLYTVAGCFASVAQWCGKGSLSNNILASVPESVRARLSAKAVETVDAIVKGKVDQFVARK